MEGLILKGVGGFYTVLDAHGDTYVCHARGKLRLDDTAPVAGDRAMTWSAKLQRSWGSAAEEPTGVVIPAFAGMKICAMDDSVVVS